MFSSRTLTISRRSTTASGMSAGTGSSSESPERSRKRSRKTVLSCIGISLTRGDPLDEGKLEQYIRRADASMYEIKQQHHADQ